MKTLTCLVALAAASLSLAPATAQLAPTGEQSQTVYYGDLDLARSEGVRMLDRRLRTAVDQVCGPVSPADPVGARRVRECRATLRAGLARRRDALLAGAAGDAPIIVAYSR